MSKSFLIGVFVLFAAPAVYAAQPVYFSVQYQGSVVLNRAFNLPNAGTASLLDDMGVSRNVDAQSVLAILSGIQDTTSAYRITGLHYYPSFNSLYLKCMQTVQNPSACDNWQYTVNGVTASDAPDVGMDQYKLAGGETVYVYFADYGLFPNAADRNSFSLFSPGPIGGSMARPSPASVPTPAVIHAQFNVGKAIEFLTQIQNKDGSFGNAPMLSDWAAIALGSFQGEIPAKTKLKEYLLTDPDPGNLLTDQERRAMALEALGINPYTGTSTNYIQKIVNGFDGRQFGNENLINDDIFALATLIPAGYRNNDEEISRDIAFLLQNQKSNGSWGDVDLTAAAVQALSQVATTSNVKDALNKAKAFLAAKQEDSGGFRNVFSTSWATQAIASLGEDQNSWNKNNHTPQDYLEFSQASDGGVQQSDTENNRMWATSYAIPAALGKDWGSILGYFNKLQAGFEKTAEPQKVTVLVQTPESENLQPLEEKISELQKQIAETQTQIALITELQAVERKVQDIAQQTKTIQAQVVALKKANAPENLAIAVARSEAQFPLQNLANEQNKSAGLSAGVVNANISWNISFVALAGVGLFLLFGGWNLVVPLVRGKMGA